MIGYYKKPIASIKKQLDRIDPDSDDLGPLVDLQIRLVRSIISAEKKIAERKSQLKADKRELRRRRLPKADAAKLKKRISRHKTQIERYTFLLYVWRCFGDGITFKYISKWNLKRLLYSHGSPDMKEGPGYLSGKRGLGGEISLLLEAKEHNVPAVLCDLTNSIRHGDLCLLGASDPYVIEVKSSERKSKRTNRQIEAIETIHNYLDNDEGNVGGFEEMRRVDLAIEEVHYNIDINSAIEAAMQNGIGTSNPEEGIFYFAINTSKKIDFERLFSGIREPVIHFLNESKTEMVWANYYPFTLSISSADALVSF